MRLALFTDIHGNREALDACLEHAADMSVDGYVVLGDLVGYGPDPAYVVERIGTLARGGAVVLRGNHDEAIGGKGSDRMNPVAARAIAWARDQLGPEARAFLSGLPMTHRREDMLFVHASADSPETWTYIDNRVAAAESLDATDARLTFCGHTHVPVVFHRLPGKAVQTFVPLPNRMMPFSRARRYLAVIGAVGQPRDHNPHACWGLLEDEGLTLHRVAYDIDATVRKIKAADLPEWLGLRLYQGR